MGLDAKVLDATNNRLKEILYVESLINLQRLILARNQISEIPANIGTLQSLKACPTDEALLVMTHPMHAKD